LQVDSLTAEEGLTVELRSDDGRASGGGDVGSGDDRSPRLSIGLPVYNGERYLEQSIESILGQTFTDFELIICDNASTDDTATICRRYVEVDPRVRYHRNPENIGGANNHNLTFELSRGELFRWASYDDVCAPELFEHCVEILDADPSIVLCHSAVASIDEAGDRIEVISRNHAMSDRPSQRFASVAVSRDYCEETYGIIRSDVFGSTRLQQNYTGSDRTLLSELALHGRFHQVPEVLFFKRMHEANRYVDWRTRSTWFDPAAGGTVSFPFWTQFADYVHTIGRVPIGLRERVSCYGFMAQWATRNSLKLVKDLLMAAYLAAHGPEWRRRRHRQTENWEVSGTGDRPARRVGLMGFFGYGNLGDEVVQNTVMRNLGARLDEVDFVGFSLEPADTEARHGIPSHPLSRIDDGADDGDGAAPGLSVRIARWMGNSRLGPVRRLERWAIRLPLEVGMAVDAFRNLRGLDALIVSGSGPLTDYWGGGGAMSFSASARARSTRGPARRSSSWPYAPRRIARSATNSPASW
jgi:glycosyltransferase involved in cell wall biosynthesis